METFKLNERLEKGGIDFGCHGICRMLLKNNSHFLWFILVPEIDPSITEIHQLSEAQYDSINHSTRFVAGFLSDRFSPEKINVGNIGNVIRQMHIHVIGRISSDPAWPSVVWACSEKQPYSEVRIAEIKSLYSAYSGENNL
ncbi:HIT domain-containing protein [Rubritalea profundi]|uniref:HIT domain-containing protein n=1 Tax=Rubritalea profundi TaxID=1658618 RepID=A0A2S7U524_9BACT|nr:HIT domain-containing protein [Rubritalea profundi]PQJ29531.1 hypothetical protein BSZ32_14205 [Rubritalea profundi]